MRLQSRPDLRLPSDVQASATQLAREVKRSVSSPRPTTDSGLGNPAAAIFELSGALGPEAMALVESRLPLLSDQQLAHLEKETDAAKKSPRVAAAIENGARIQTWLEDYWKPHTDDKIRLAVPGLVASDALTATQVSKLQTVLLVGPVTKKFALSVDPSKPLDLTQLFDKSSPLYETDLGALKKLHAHAASKPAAEREPFLRAAAYELGKMDRELVVRLVEQLGVDAIKTAAPGVAGTTPAEVAKDLRSQEKVAGYLRATRVPGEIAAYTPSPALKAEIAKAHNALAKADDYATKNGVSAASKPEVLTEARRLYGEAAVRFRGVLATDKMALQDPAVKEWMGRRGRALFIQAAVNETQTGISGTGFMDWARRTIRKIPGLAKVVDAPGLAEKKFVEHLEKALGFDPTQSRTPADRAKLIARLESELVVDGKKDPLVAVDLAPQATRAKYSDVEVVFAPGVVPIDGVLEDTFADVQARTGIKTRVASTGFFHSEEDNARDLADAFGKVDPNAKIVLYGYSQGAANGLYYLDQLRSGSSSDRALADRVVGVASLYGAHNGSTAAEDGVELVKHVLGQVSGGKSAEYLVSGTRGLGRWIGGGVDSLKRSTRAEFWDIANLPSDIPYLSVSAATKPEEVPLVLKKGYADMKKAAAKLGLAPDNDTQVLRCDAALGNEETKMGRAVRRNTVNLEVTGHHWNPLRARHMNWDDAGKYAFPKAPQIESQLHLLGELGLLD